jgi:tetratricopeptide (TPR) repeat protein
MQHNARTILNTFLGMSLLGFLSLLSVNPAIAQENTPTDSTEIAPSINTLWQSLFEAAQAYYNEENFEEAEKMATAALDLNYNPNGIHALRGNIRYKAGKKTEADLDFEKALSFEPQNTEILYNRGLIAYETKDFDKAVGFFTHCIQLKPTFAKAWFSRGLIYQKQNNPASAQNDYTEAIRNDPQNPNYFNNRGVIRMQNNDLRGAVHDFTKAIDFNENNGFAYRNRGLCLIALKENIDGCFDLKKAAELNVNDAPLLLKQYCP